jgi:phage terminase large subunit-like protein
MASGTATARARKRRAAPAPADGHDYAEIARRWEDDVLAGRSPMGALVAKAIERQRRELAAPPDGYAWDEDEANKACSLAEELAFPKGPKRGQRFHLEPWEVWFLRCIFGWVDSVTRLPRFHKVTAFIPKGNGKSPLAAAIGLIVIARGRAIGAKVFSAAVTEKQANNVFQPAQEMLRLSPRVLEAAQLVVTEHAIKGIGDPRIFERVSAEKRSADGTVGDCYVVDEIHQHPSRALYDVLANNASKVDGSRIIVISTAGTDPSPSAVGWILYGEAKDILLEKTSAPAHFVLIFEADRQRPDGSDADPWDEATWRQANPNFGVSISTRNFRTTADAARADPTAQPHFFATRLGWWSRSAEKWMDPVRWAAAAVSVKEEQFPGHKLFIGVDYAPSLDLTAIVQVATTELAPSRRQYIVRAHAFLPEKSPTLLLKEFAGHKEWVKGGWLTLTPGTQLDAGYLRPILVALVKKYPGAEVDLDPFGCIELMASLPRDGVEPTRVNQNWKFHSPAMTEVQVALDQGRLLHDGGPLMAMCMSNVVALPDRNGNVVPDRKSTTEKIDLAVGLLNAIYRAQIADLAPPAPQSSYLESGELLVLS